MIFNAKEFFSDYSIEWREHGHKHCRPGWIQTACPFCTGNPGYHLGYNLDGGFFTCWRCGFHSVIEVVKALSGQDWGRAKKAVSEYNRAFSLTSAHTPTIRQDRRISVRLPRIIHDLKAPHMRYLKKRGYNPRKLAKIWGLMGTGPVGDYKHRIIAPITLNGRLVSYQGRDYTEKSRLRYKACKQRDELIDHKNLLYGLDQAKGTSCILVEGITDVWRLGPGAVATFGIKYKPSQFQLLWERFSKVFVMYDNDPQAIKQAKKIANELVVLFDLDVEICIIKSDPGKLSQKTADKYVRQLLG